MKGVILLLVVSKIARPICIYLVIVMMMTSIFVVSPQASGAASSVNVRLDKAYDIDVFLAVGNANQDISKFETDLKNELSRLGIPTDRIKISAVEATSVSSETSSAADIVNGWIARPIGTEMYAVSKETDYSARYSVDSVNNRIVSTSSSARPAAVYYNPEGFNTRNAVIEYQWGITNNAGSFGHGEAGFIFRMDPTRESFYTYTLDNHAACGNLMNFGLDGTPAEAILKFTNGSSNPNGKNANIAQKNGLDMYSANLATEPAALKLNDFQPYAKGRVEYVKIELTGPNIKVYRRQNTTDSKQNPTISDPYKLVFDWTDTSGSPLNSGTYGFYVWDQSGAYFSDIKLTTESTKNFLEIIREPNWRDTSKRFLVNLEDEKVNDFDSPTALGEILTRMNNEDVHYIGWGKDSNKDQADELIAKNDGKGTFINRSDTSYADSIEQMAQYIAREYTTSIQTDVEYWTYGSPVNVEVSPESLASNTADELWPSGKWIVQHNPMYGEIDTAPFHNQYLENFSDITFNWLGQYDIYFEDQLVKTVFVHRKPVSKFELILGEISDGEVEVIVTDLSYDPDDLGSTDIVQKWRWKKTTDENWMEDIDSETGKFIPPTVLEADSEYIIELTVKDRDGEWSLPYSRYVSTSGNSGILPIAEFSLKPSTVYKHIDSIVTVNDTSYGPTGDEILTKTWKVTIAGKPSVITVGDTIDFSEYEAGEYKVSLQVNDSNGNKSNWFTRIVQVIDDTSVPTLVADRESGDIFIPDNITLIFSDAGGSGLSYQKYALTNSADSPDALEWSSASGNKKRNVHIKESGTWYIHYEAMDHAGNILDGYLGPFTAYQLTNHKTTLPGQPISFNETDFIYEFDESITIERIMISKLPEHGVLKLNDTPLSVTDVVYANELNQIIYEPELNWHGVTSFKWIGQDETTDYPEVEVILIINTVPVVVDTTKQGTTESIITFSPSDFVLQDADTDTLTKIKITTLPDNGILKLNGTPITVNQEISISDTALITFEPDKEWSGTTSFNWLGYDGYTYSGTEALLTLVVRTPIIENEEELVIQPKTETITVNVDADHGGTVTQATITRTTDSNGRVTDQVTFSGNNAMEAVKRLGEKGADTARIVIPDNADKVAETNVNIPKTALEVLAGGKTNLAIDTPNGRVVIPYSSLAAMTEDLYFRIVPIKEEDKKNEVIRRVQKEEMVREISQDNTVRILGRPLTIETNMKSQPVKIILPLYDRLPEDPAKREQILENLVIFIEHDDGTKELVKGKVTNYSESQDMGIEFDIEKFSTFTMVYMEGWKEYFAALQKAEAEKNKQAGTHNPYIYGLPDGTFGPDKTVTRSQMAAMLARNLGTEYIGNGISSFTDTHSNHWAFKEIEVVNQKGLMTGYPDSRFGAEDGITRAQMAMIVDRWMTQNGKSITINTSTTNFADLSSHHWAFEAILRVQAYGIMVGYEDHSFKPDQMLTRAEAVKVLNRLFERGPLYGVEKPSFIDVPMTHWAFLEVEEAAQEHHWKRDQNGREVYDK